MSLESRGPLSQMGGRAVGGTARPLRKHAALNEKSSNTELREFYRFESRYPIRRGLPREIIAVARRCSAACAGAPTWKARSRAAFGRLLVNRVTF